MLKSLSLSLYLYITLLSIVFIRNQNTNKLIVLNDKQFPVFLSAYKNETHYFIITSGEYLIIDIKTGNIERISAERNTYTKYCVFFTDPSNINYMFYDYINGYFLITGITPKFISSDYKFSFSDVTSIIGSMKDINDVIIYGYRTNIILFLYITRKISTYAFTSLKKLTSCKILQNYQKYLCTCNNENDKINFYILLSSGPRLSVDNIYQNPISELNGYIDGYLYDTLNLNNKILCSKKKNNI